MSLADLPESIIKLFETIVINGLGAAFRPFQIERIGKSEIRVKRLQRLSDAQTDLDVEAIKRGEKILDLKNGLLQEDDRLKSLPRLPNEAIASPPGNAISVLRDSERSATHLNLRRFENVRAAIEHAAEELILDPEVSVSNQAVDPDWFQKWRTYAEEVSNEERQRLWGKVLAEETRMPASFSLRSLSLLSLLSNEEASTIQTIAPLIIDNSVIYPDHETWKHLGVDERVLADLESIGLLNGVASTVSHNFQALELSEHSMYEQFRSGFRLGRVHLRGDYMMIVKFRHGYSSIQAQCITLSKSAKEILSLLPNEPPPTGYLQLLLGVIAGVGVEAEVWRTGFKDGKPYFCEQCDIRPRQIKYLY